jgi:hypothetical protein
VTFVESLVAFEEALESEMQVQVPDGLADRVLLHVRQNADQTYTRPSAADQLRAVARKITGSGLAHTWWGWRPRFAIVAVLLLGIAITLFQASPLKDEGPAIADIAHVAHVAQERMQDLEAPPAADSSALPRVLAASGIRLPSDFREVRYLGRCGPPDRSGQHIVMQTGSGIASLVLMPDESAGFRIVQFEDGRIAVVAPAPVGSLAVVADSREAAVQIAVRLL